MDVWQNAGRMTDGTDRRRAPRFAARIKVRFRSVEELVTAYTDDISRGGLFVTSTHQLPPGSRVQLQMELPDEGPAARVPAEVAYTLSPEEAEKTGRQPGMGMKFLEADIAPLAARIAVFLSATVDAEEQAGDAPIHVLVVDDSTSYRGAVAAALKSAGHRVTEAEHGLDALGKAMKEPPDLVLTDVTMPVMDGWQLLRLLRARDKTKSVPVVFLTTLDSDADRIKGYELGIDDFIAKPSAAEELLARVRRVVARARREGVSDEGMSGSLEQVALTSLLAFAEAERRTGVLAIARPGGEAKIGLVDGMIVSVELPGGQLGASLFESLLSLLDWTEGRFALHAVEVVAGDERVSVQGALLEHARRQDEAGA